MRFLASLWGWLRRPSRRALGLVLLGGVVLGILFWGGFNWGMELSNTETFCISCHEMRSTVYEELKKTIHFSNRSGVRATCPDCHVPKEWVYKVVRKARATVHELPLHLVGARNTREKFEAHRLAMAERVWAAMKATDSRECRNCHHMDSMDLARQKPRARGQHEDARASGETCIDCHKGIAHKPMHKQAEGAKKGEEEDGGFMLDK